MIANRLGAPALSAALLVGALLAAADLQRVREAALVVYATPALKELLDEDVVPGYLAATGREVAPAYMAAGEQFNRLRLSGHDPEAALFLHASPLYLEKGAATGNFVAWRLAADASVGPSFLGPSVEGGRVWRAFAWTPLVTVHRGGEAPDLAATDLRFGLSHPLLSNSGIYNVVLFETVDPAAGARALSRTAVQPVNARAAVNGVADGSYDATLGYEAVGRFFQSRGADVALDLPVVDGVTYLVPVVLVVGVVAGPQHVEAERFAAHLFEPATQARLAARHFRPVMADAPLPAGGVDASEGTPLPFDWSQWRRIEARLGAYEVRT